MHRERGKEREMRGPRRRDFGHELLSGLGAEWGGAWGGRGPRRMRRGDIRTALLVALQDGPAHGYELIGRLEEKSGGVWRPSPGSVYPTLQLFEDEGLVKVEERDGKRVFALTDAGTTEASERAERYGATPWESGTGDLPPQRALWKALAQLVGAMRQVSQTADAAQVERATTAVRGATKELYQILSDD
ncbi:MAG TPA: PadR family transcriptional regulator [Acidimicrobiales bacterium]|nr:PadR family transcriptional regulator [Acidimicrobiales bacterium]